MIQNIDLQIKCGSDYLTIIPVYDDNGELRNLSGYSIYAQLRETAVSTQRIEFDTALRDDYGAVILSLGHDKTEAISYNRGVYDVFIVKADEREAIAQGYAVVYRDVTKIPEYTAGIEVKTFIFNNVGEFPQLGSIDRLYLSALTKSFYIWFNNEYRPVNYFYSSSQTNPYLPYEILTKHAHTGNDDSAKVDYNDLKNKPLLPNGVMPHVHNGTDSDRINGADLIGIVPIASGGTGANTVQGILANLGITNLVNNLINNVTSAFGNLTYKRIGSARVIIGSIPPNGVATVACAGLPADNADVAVWVEPVAESWEACALNGVRYFSHVAGYLTVKATTNPGLITLKVSWIG